MKCCFLRQEKNKHMPDKTPLDYSFLHYSMILGLGALGGLVARLQKLAGVTNPPPLKVVAVRILADMITSGFCGLLAFWVCEHIEIKPLVTVVVIGISGHMGSRILFLVEKILSNKLKAYFG